MSGWILRTCPRATQKTRDVRRDEGIATAAHDSSPARWRVPRCSLPLGVWLRSPSVRSKARVWQVPRGVLRAERSSRRRQTVKTSGPARDEAWWIPAPFPPVVSPRPHSSPLTSAIELPLRERWRSRVRAAQTKTQVLIGRAHGVFHLDAQRQCVHSRLIQVIPARNTAPSHVPSAGKSCVGPPMGRPAAAGFLTHGNWLHSTVTQPTPQRAVG